MPIIEFQCCCGVVYDVLRGSTISDKGNAICPACGASEGQEEQISNCSFTGFTNEHLMDPVERQMILNNRKMHEDLILTGSRDLGEFKVKENGPAWTRPFGNDSFERKKAIEDKKLVK